MKEHRDPSSAGPVIRAELVIATLALLASAGASVAAILQTHESAIETQATLEQTRIVSKQLGSSLWPYLALAHSVSFTGVRIGFTNDGLGPALVRSFDLELDHRPITKIIDIAAAFDPNTHAEGRRIGESDFGRGSVIRPSESVTILSIADARFSTARERRAFRRVSLTVCYCSLLDECWSLKSTDTEPQSVRSCPDQKQPIAL